MGFYDDCMGFYGMYALVNIDITMKNHHVMNGKTHYDELVNSYVTNYQRLTSFLLRHSSPDGNLRVMKIKIRRRLGR